MCDITPRLDPKQKKSVHLVVNRSNCERRPKRSPVILSARACIPRIQGHILERHILDHQSPDIDLIRELL